MPNEKGQRNDRVKSTLARHEETHRSQSDLLSDSWFWHQTDRIMSPGNLLFGSSSCLSKDQLYASHSYWSTTRGFHINKPPSSFLEQREKGQSECKRLFLLHNSMYRGPCRELCSLTGDSLMEGMVDIYPKTSETLAVTVPPLPTSLQNAKCITY